MTGQSKAMSLEGHVSLDPRDYVWGPVSAAQQHQMFAQFMGMTQVALMCGCALLPPPGLGAPLPSPSISAPPNHGFPAFWPTMAMPPRPMAGPPYPVIPLPEKIAAPVPLPTSFPLGPSPACWAAAAAPASIQRPPATPKTDATSLSNDISLAAATTTAAAQEVKSASGSANPSPSRAPASTSAPGSSPRGSLKKRAPSRSNGTKSKPTVTGSKQAQQAREPVVERAVQCGPESSPALPEGCSLDLLEALPLDLDDIRQLFQEDLAQELQQHHSLSSRTSQGSQDTMFHSAADAATAAAPAPPACMGAQLLLESLDGPLSLASFDQSFDQSFEQLSREFKAIGNSFDALADLGSILDVHMDDDLALASLSCPGVVSGSGSAKPSALAKQPAVGSSGVNKELKLSRSKSGVMKKSGDKGAAKAFGARRAVSISPIEDLLNFV